MQARKCFIDLCEAFGCHQIGVLGDRAIASRGGPAESFPYVNLQFIWRNRVFGRFDSEHNQEGLTMIRKFALALTLAFTASLVVQIAAMSQASAGKTCTYTSSDKKKGYKC